MSCYHPLYGEFVGYEDGKPAYKFSGQSIPGFKKDSRDIHVPCGQCIGCRLDKSRHWADRMMLELDHSKSALFLTLTYDEEHIHPSVLDDVGIPLFYTLDKRDAQLFLKRLRKYFCDKELRFFLCGEYGDNRLRPHYHAIVFGLDFADFPDYQPVCVNEFEQYSYRSDILNRIWHNGLATLSAVSWQTCAYVSRYVTKKLNGDKATVYAERNCIPEFALMSRRPGIGYYYMIDHPDVFDSSKISISDLNGVNPRTSVSLPKYFISKLDLTNPELYDKLCNERRRFAEDSALLKFLNTDLEPVNYLRLEERLQNESAKRLIRKEF